MIKKMDCQYEIRAVLSFHEMKKIMIRKVLEVYRIAQQRLIGDFYYCLKEKNAILLGIFFSSFCIIKIKHRED
jgi:hypothetical protein